ncbi:MAG: NUDIX domain-containing protein [Gammaproteobacteria bacterium]|nr:NUDIX domain-containing protein [Gammaproteobacteria bacterium]
MAGVGLSAGVIVVRWEVNDWKFLLLRAYQHWDFPKGMVEKGEDPLVGAKREVEEETTLNDLNFRWGYEYRETPPYGRGKIARYYIATTLTQEISLPISEELGHPEHEEYCWVDYVQAVELVSERVKPILAWAHEILYPHQES